MTDEVIPKGYVGLHEALRRLADIPQRSAEDWDLMYIGDRLDEAEALHEATRDLRQRLTDGELRGYRSPEQVVPAWIWTNDEACLTPLVRDPQFGHIRLFHEMGVEIEGTRHRVFLSEEEFEAFRKGDLKRAVPLAPKGKKPPGRPPGVGAFDDECWLLEIDKLVEEGMGPKTAANVVVAENASEIHRKPGTPDDSVAQRLYRKWKDSRGPAS